VCRCSECEQLPVCLSIAIAGWFASGVLLSLVVTLLILFQKSAYIYIALER
jgi:hypothetical protein